ncbi:hypothetical protein ACLOAV_010299 [Pseudogymnoascus australis]
MKGYLIYFIAFACLAVDAIAVLTYGALVAAWLPGEDKATIFSDDVDLFNRTQADIQEMVSYGINTISIPMGYWLKEDLVYADSEHFPQGRAVAGFYVDYQFERALKLLECMVDLIYTDNNYRNVGMLELVNEPIQNSGNIGTMRSTYYPDAFSRIRAAESKLGVGANDLLHIQMMNEK